MTIQDLEGLQQEFKHSGMTSEAVFTTQALIEAHVADEHISIGYNQPEL